MMKQRYYKNPNLTVFLRIAALALAIWLMCMAVLTVITARLYTELFAEDIGGIQGNLTLPQSISEEVYSDPEQLNKSIKNAVTLLDTYDNHDGRIRGSVSEFLLSADSEYQVAAGVFSPGNELLMMSGSDYVAFGYCTAGEYNPWGSIDPTKVAYTKMSGVKLGRETLRDYKRWIATMQSNSLNGIVRLTGYFEGLEFVPLSFDYAYKSIKFDNIKWDNLSEAEEAVGREIESIYIQNHSFYGFKYEKLLELDKKESGIGEYLCSLAAAAGKKAQGAAYLGNSNLDRVSMREVLMVDYRPVTLNREDDPDEPMVYYLAFAMRAEPLKTAVSKLVNVYIVSFAVTVLLALLLFRSVKRWFIDPVQVTHIGVVDGWGYVSTKLDKPIKWKAAAELRDILQKRE